MVPASVNDKYVIRFCAVAQNACDDDIGNIDCWNWISPIFCEPGILNQTNLLRLFTLQILHGKL